jgi:hypothetical protein
VAIKLFLYVCLWNKYRLLPASGGLPHSSWFTLLASVFAVGLKT